MQAQEQKKATFHSDEVITPCPHCKGRGAKMVVVRTACGKDAAPMKCEKCGGTGKAGWWGKGEP